MMYTLIDTLVAAIKEEDAYQKLRESERALQDDEVQALLRSYQQALEHQSELAAYAPYIDTSDADAKIEDLREQIKQNDIIKHYQKCYVTLSRMLDDITEIVFDGISDDLTTGRMGKLYARYRRKV